MRRFFILLGLIFTAMFVSPRVGAAPLVTIVVDPQAPKLERFAADELSAIAKRLTGGEARILATLPVGDEPAILVGNPKTNPEIERAVGKQWPTVSDQGLVLKSVKQGNRDLLVVGGGSSSATLWAVYELGHRHGVRYLMQSDVYPPEPVPLEMAGFDVVLEPAIKVRSLALLGDSPISTSSWSLSDHERLLGQLAKMKFNRIVLNVGSSGLFSREETGKRTLSLWRGTRFTIDGDTAGRAAFRGAKEFENPDLAAANSPDALHEACMRLVAGIRKRAAELGMQVVETNASDRKPRIQVLHPDLALPALNTQAVANLTLELPATGEPLAYDPTPAGDLNPAVYHLSRAGYDAKLTPAETYRELFVSICGNREVGDRLVRGFQQMDEATNLIGRHGFAFARLKQDTLLAEYEADRGREWFKQVKEHYTQSMIEMFRARDNCRADTKPLLYYHCKRGEFAVEYLNCVEAVQQAGAAKRGGDREKCAELLEKGVESLYNGINSLSEVARDQSDRGLIAVLNEYAYRPLVELLETELDAAQ
jgi:hypothetical protein